jgi:hypothetical protein
MRREHSEVTNPREIERILRETNIGRMASTGDDGYPYITPVNFVYYEGAIYFHSAPDGEKLDNIARNPRVCFEVDAPLSYLDAGFDPQRRGCKGHQYYHCALVAKHEPGVALQPITEDLSAYRACAVIAIRPRTISAKSDLGQNKTREERLSQARYLRSRNRPGDEETVRAMGFTPGEL